MKKYFLYLLKKNLIPLAVLTLFCILMYVLPISTENYNYWNNGILINGVLYYNNPSLHYINIIISLGIISVFIPIAMFAYKMNKRSVDMHYSLPISKTKILIANFLVGLILMYASYSIAYWLGFIIIAVKVQRLYLINYLYLYLASLIPAFITYTVTSFIFTRANTHIDGIISLAGAMCLLALSVSTVNDLLYPFSWYPRRVESALFFPFASLAQTSIIFGEAILSGKVYMWLSSSPTSYQFLDDVCFLISDIIWLLIAIAATVGMIMTEKNSKAENCGQISESIFCHKVQIPAFVALLTALTVADGGNIVLLCLIAFGAFIWSIIYKRSIKIGWKFAVVLIASMVGGLLLYAIPTIIYNVTMM